MSDAVRPSRTISEIKVTQSDTGALFGRARIRIDWIGVDGAEEHIERHGPAAALIIGDLRNTLQKGVSAHDAYLFGYIRCHTLRRGND